MSSKILFFYWNLFSVMLLMCKANQERQTHHRDINNNFMKINEKIDFLSQKIEKLEENSPTKNNVLSEMMNAIVELNKKTEKILEFIESANIKKEDSGKWKRDVLSKLGSQCSSMCDSQVDLWVNETSNRIKGKLENFDFCLNNSKPFSSDLNPSDACDPNPCLNGGHCQPLSYECTKCPFPTSGRRCENLNCNKTNRCVQYQNTLYVVIEESSSWDHGYKNCISQGMTLAMPKEQETSEFLINHLKTIYLPSRGLHFWIGVKNNGTAVYRWNDGTLLGSYTGGKPDFKGMTGERWGLMWLHGGAVTWWPRSLGEISSNYGITHFTLCEKPISIR